MGLDKARLAFNHAGKRRSLLPELVEKGFVTRETFEEAELGYLNAKADLQIGQFNFNTVSAGATPQELKRAEIRLKQGEIALEKAQLAMKLQLESSEATIEKEEANMDQARGQLNKAQRKLKRTVLKAPKDGLVVYASAGEKSSEKIQLGMIPFEGQPLLYLPDLSTMVVDTEVNEIDIGKVKVGGLVAVGLEAYPAAVFHGKVLKIGSLAKFKRNPSGQASGIKVFDVTVRVDEKDTRLKPGLTARRF